MVADARAKATDEGQQVGFRWDAVGPVVLQRPLLFGFIDRSEILGASTHGHYRLGWKEIWNRYRENDKEQQDSEEQSFCRHKTEAGAN